MPIRAVIPFTRLWRIFFITEHLVPHTPQVSLRIRHCKGAGNVKRISLPALKELRLAPRMPVGRESL